MSKDLQETLLQYLREVQKLTFISYFSEKTNSILMSHYTNNHQGFCLEYELIDPMIGMQLLT